MLWIDKHQPRRLAELQGRPELTSLLQKTAKTPNLPHLLFHGPPGAGKQTRILALLREIFGSAIDNIRAATIAPEGTNVEFVTCSSMFHHQVSAAELGTRDRICVQHMIKQLASQTSAAAYTFTDSNIPKYRIFVIQEAEKLSNEAQAGLRRTLEKYVRNARVILHCTQLSAIMPPLRSRCLCIRVPLPTDMEVTNVLLSICQIEGISLPEETIQNIVTSSRRNLRQAILRLETSAMVKTTSQLALSLPWELQCKEITEKVFSTTGIRCLLEVREVLYDLLTTLVPPEIILETLCRQFVARTTIPAVKFNTIRAAAHYAHTLAVGNRPIWHLEAFIAQALNFINRPSDDRSIQ